MESLVSKNNSLRWQGWDILFLEEDSSAYMNKNAMFVDSKWHKATIIANKDGYWKIPGSVVRKLNV